MNEYKEMPKTELIGHLMAGKKMQAMGYDEYCFYDETAEKNPFRLDRKFESSVPMDLVWKGTQWREYKEISLKDKELCYAWDDDFKSDENLPVLGFYDAKNNSLFYPDGCRYGSSWNNYLLVEIESLPEPLKTMMLKCQKNLED
jgi:hypothetical protein